MNMIKILTTLILVPFIVNAQSFLSNKNMFGGAFSYSSYSGDLYEDADGKAITAIAVQPSFSLIRNGFLFGPVVKVGYVTQGEMKNMQYEGGLELAYFLSQSNDKPMPFIGMGARFRQLSADLTGQSTPDLNGSWKVSYFVASVNCGMLTMLTEKLGLMTGLSLNFQTKHDILEKGDFLVTSFPSHNSKFNLGLSVGINYVY